MRHLLTLAVVLLLVPTTVSAQTPGPAPSAPFPIAPDPSACIAAPRTVAEIEALAPPLFVLAAGATPAPSPDPRREILRGPTEPASPEQIAGITATSIAFTACLTKNDGARLAGLYTDNLLASGIIAADSIDALGPPMPAGERVTLIDILTPRAFSDGRVGAIVLFSDLRSGSPIDSEFIVFSEQDDRWLIDDVPAYAVASSTAPSPAEAVANRAAWGLVEPDPAACHITPRDADALATLEATSAAGPNFNAPARTPEPAWPSPSPADPMTVTAIEATVTELAACTMTGNELQIAAFFTDDLIASPSFSFNADTENTEGDAFNLTVYAVYDDGDGRVGVVMGYQVPRIAAPVYPLFVVFELVADRWLIADIPLPGYVTSDSAESEGNPESVPTIPAAPAATPTS